ncbi:MAG: hypothetical protein KBB83_01795, partial [Alphaproteobacteria bacterium]|nr:hypothetical protein [Alphaproteobacteria bacterium]
MNKIIIYLSFLSIFTSFPSKACVQEEDIEGLYESLAPQDRSLSPVNGLIVLRSGQLWKARFDGRFGEYKPEYLCHYSILNPTRHAPRANVDSPHDCTSSIIQQIFPSPAGGRLSIPGNHGDMFRLMPIGEIGRLLMAYVRVKNGADAVVLDELFSSYFVPQQGQAKKAEGWAIKRSNRKEMEKLWTKEVFAVLPKRYASMFAGAIKETSRYPDCFVESTLLALAVAKAQSVSDLQPLLEEIGYPDAGKNSTHRFNKSFYESWLGRLHSKERRDIELLLRDPEALIYLTLAQDKYGSAFPKSLGAGTAVHTYLDENGVERKESFSDCGESSARAFWDKVVANLATRTFDTKFLEAAFPNLSRNFIYFYNGNPHKSGGFAQLKFEDINDGEEGRSA